MCKLMQDIIDKEKALAEAKAKVNTVKRAIATGISDTAVIASIADLSEDQVIQIVNFMKEEQPTLNKLNLK